VTDHDRVLSAAAAVLAAGLAPDAVLVVLDDEPALGALGALCAALHTGVVLTAADARALQGQITTPTGRADAIVTTRAARSAVRAVRRGGTVCLPWADVDAPSVTELVQREVRLVGTDSLQALMASYPDAAAQCLRP